MREIVSEHRNVAIFFLVYYVALLGVGALNGAAQTVFYAVFLACGAAVVAWLYPRARFSSLVLWGLALWGCAHMVGGLVEIGGRVVYERQIGPGELRFDKFVHFFGFGFATLASYELLRSTIGRADPPGSVAIVAFFIGLGLGAVNETIEFLITRLPGDSNVGGFSNTGWDLVANALGAALAARLAPRLSPPRTSPN